MTVDSMAVLLEEIETNTWDVCEHFEHCYHFQSAFEHSPETSANCVIGIDWHDVSLKPKTLEDFWSQGILWPVTIVWICPVVAAGS